MCGFDDEEDAKKFGCKVIDTDEAYDRLAKERPGLYFPFPIIVMGSYVQDLTNVMMSKWGRLIFVRWS